MDIATQRRLRELFDHTHALDEDARRAYLDAAALEPLLRDGLEALLAASVAADAAIAARVQRAATDALDAQAAPLHLGPYRITGIIGEGGMGTVWRGERDDGEFVRQVAIKVIRGMASPAAIERLRRERQLLAGLTHAGIARLLDGGTTPAGEPYLVIEYIAGQSLLDWLADTKPSLRTRLDVFARVCDAVQFAHRHLVVHCDIKPANILVRDGGEPVLLDFGIARLVDAGGAASHTNIAATPAYAAPEQLLGQPVTMATDVFGLGMVLYEMLAGAVPTRRNDVDSLARELTAPSDVLARAGGANDVITPVALRGDLDSIVRRAVRVEAAHRYASVGDLANDVRAWLAGRPVAAAGRQWPYLTGKFLRRHRVGVALGVAALAGLAMLSVSLALQYREAIDARLRAEQAATAAQATAAFLQGLYTELDPSLHGGRSVDARELLDLGRERLAELDDTAPGTRAALERTLADIYLQIGKPEPALELAKQAAARLDRATADARERIAVDALLGRAYNAALDFTAAREANARALAGADALGDTALAAPILTSHAWSSLAGGDVATARANYDRAEAIYREQGEKAREPLARIGYNRAQVAEADGDNTLALALYQRAVIENGELSGRDAPITILSQFGVGKVLIFLGRNLEARDVLLDVAARSDRVHGPNTMATERATAELGNAERELGMVDSARARFQSAMRISLAVNAGRETVQLSNHINNLALVEETCDNLDVAEPLMRRALALRESLGGPASLAAAFSRNNLARFALTRGDYETARAEIDLAVRIRREKLPATHELVVLSEALQTEIAAASGHPERALLTVAQLEATLVRQPPMLARARVQVLRALVAHTGARGDLAARIAALRREFAELTSSLSATHPTVGIAHLRLAEALIDNGDARAAAQELDAATSIIRDKIVASSPLYARRDRLAAHLATIVHP